MSKKLIGVIEILETRIGLRKGDAASIHNAGDGLFKIKIDPNVDPMIQVESLYHEWAHFVFSVFKAKKGGKGLTDKEEESICEEIGTIVRKIFKRHFGEKK